MVGVPGAMGEILVDIGESENFIVEKFQKILKNQWKFIIFEDFKGNFAIFWKTF